MKISVAQIKPVKGDVQANIERHKDFIKEAVSLGATAIFFPELSITGYEPTLAKGLATDKTDSRFNNFEQLSDENKIAIALGAPTRSDKGIQISTIIFQPGMPRKAYAKQHLHEDEYPYFVRGEEQLLLTVDGYVIAPAICYESLLDVHSSEVYDMGARFYVASVAKSPKGVEKAYKHYPNIARKYAMPVLMANCIGACDNFESAGQSAAWNSRGVLLGQLNNDREGMLMYDTATEQVMAKPM